MDHGSNPPGGGGVATAPLYQQAWFFEPFFFLLCWTAVPSTRTAIPPASAGCQAGWSRILGLVGKKCRPLDSPNPDDQGICSATLSVNELCNLRVMRAMRIGYARVSTADQHLDLQQDALRQAGCEKIVVDRVSETVADRPGLARVRDMLRPGYMLVV